MATFHRQGPWVLPDPVLVPVIDGGRFLAITGRLERFSGRWLRLKVGSPEQIDRLRRDATIESVASSTRIEGATLTNDEVRQVLEGVDIERFSDRDEQEVRGYRDLLELIWEQHQDLHLTENALKEFHRVLLAHSDKDAYHRGEYKRSPNHVERVGEGPPVVVFRTAPPPETRWWMTRLVEEFNAGWDDPEWHRLVLIADFVLWFLAIHPFQDGNGRLARALTSLLLLRGGFDYVPYASLESIIEQRKAGYYIALQRSQVAARSDARFYADWLEFFLSALAAQQEVLERRLGEVSRRRTVPELAASVLELITIRGPMTSTDIAAALHISPRTVRYHLARLSRDGLLEAPRQTAGRRYGLPVREAIPAHVAAPAPPPRLGEAGSLVSADAERGLLTPLDFQPAVQRQLAVSPNGRAFATIVITSQAAYAGPLGDRELDACESLAAAIAPAASAVKATPQVAWWNIPDEPRLATFQLWLYPGPVVQVHWALDPSSAPDDAILALDPVTLVTYWRQVLRNVVRVSAGLGLAESALGLNVQTLPAGRPHIVDIEFSEMPRPTRSGIAESVPPWSANPVTVSADRLADDSILRPSLDQLLRHFSYRHTDATLHAVFMRAGSTWRTTDVAASVCGFRGGGRG